MKDRSAREREAIDVTDVITRGTTPRSGERAPVGSPVDERWAGAEEAPVPLGAREDAGIEAGTDARPDRAPTVASAHTNGACAPT